MWDGCICIDVGAWSVREDWECASDEVEEYDVLDDGYCDDVDVDVDEEEYDERDEPECDDASRRGVWIMVSIMIKASAMVDHVESGQKNRRRTQSWSVGWRVVPSHIAYTITYHITPYPNPIRNDSRSIRCFVGRE